MTPVEVLAAHHEELTFEGLKCTGCDWSVRHADIGGWRNARTAHAAHVLDALTKAGHETAPLGTIARASLSNYYLRKYEERGDELVRLRVEIRELRAAAETGGKA